MGVPTSSLVSSTAWRRQGLHAKPHLYKSFAGWVCAGGMIVIGGRSAREAFAKHEDELARRSKAFNPRTRYADERGRMHKPWR